jgi:hypothetical protein
MAAGRDVVFRPNGNGRSTAHAVIIIVVCIVFFGKRFAHL